MTGRIRAIVLAAGFATRLYPLTKTCAKPLLEVGGVPLLSHLVRYLEALESVEDLVVVTNGKFHEDFRRWRTGERTRLQIHLVNDGVTDDRCNLGAIADLELALRSAPSLDVAGYLVLAGDNLFDFDLAPLAQRLLASGRAQLLLREIPPPLPARKYNEVVLGPGGRVVSLREKPELPRAPLASIAVYGLPRTLPELVSSYLAEGGHTDAPGYLLEWLVEHVETEGVRFEGRWFDLGDLADLERARAAYAP